jgi:hypothetical protein
MNQFDILLPFGLPPAEMALDLTRALQTSALATLLAHAKAAPGQTFDAFSRTLPHETWLARQFGLDWQPTSGSPPLATIAMQAAGLPVAAGHWFMLQPVHIHVARDHLVLTDQRQLIISEEEARALFDTARSLVEESGKTLLYGDAHTWFIRADDWSDLQTSTPDAVCGHNVDIWMPQGSGERDWRKLQNEIQMHWHIHPVNAAREAMDTKTINSVWIWGGANAISVKAPPYTDLIRSDHWLDALRQAAGLPQRYTGSAGSTDILTTPPQHGLLVLDQLVSPALNGDHAEWLARMHALEADWFAPMLAALKTGRIDRLSVIMTHNTRLCEWTATRASLRKFWIKPSLARLLP